MRIYPFQKIWVTLLSLSLGLQTASALAEEVRLDLEVAQPSISLSWALSEALRVNPEMLAAKKRAEAAGFRPRQVASLEAPEVSASFEDIPTADPGRAMEKTVTIGQRIPWPGKLFLRGKVAKKEALQAEAEYRVIERRLISLVKKAYYEYFLIQKELDIHHAHELIEREMARVAEVKYATGQVGQQDVLKAQLEFHRLLNRILILKAQQEAVRAKLNALINRAPEEPLGRAEAFTVPETLMPAPQLYQLAETHSPEIFAAQVGVDRANLAKKLASLEWIPDFFLDVSPFSFDRGFTGWGLAGGLSIPFALWSIQKVIGMIKEAKAEEEASKASLAWSRRKVALAVKEARVRAESAQYLWNLYEKSIVPLSEEGFRATQRAYMTGQSDFLMLLDSQRTLLTSEIE
ncbi:MAG: TolC family protein, partial [Candidatus Omnitrophota bacterium]